MNKEYIDAIRNNKTLYTNEFLMMVVYLATIIICSLPLFSINESIIKNTSEFRNFADNLSYFFPAFENIANNAKVNNLYYFAKFQLSWGVCSIIIVFPLSFFYMGKIYLYNLGFIQANKKRYDNAIIRERGYHGSSIYTYVLSILGYILMSEFFLFESVFRLSNISGHIFDTTFFGLVSTSIIICSSFSFFGAYIILETICRIRVVFSKYKISGTDHN